MIKTLKKLLSPTTTLVVPQGYFCAIQRNGDLDPGTYTVHRKTEKALPIVSVGPHTNIFVSLQKLKDDNIVWCCAKIHFHIIDTYLFFMKEPFAAKPDYVVADCIELLFSCMTLQEITQTFSTEYTWLHNPIADAMFENTKQIGIAIDSVHIKLCSRKEREGLPSTTVELNDSNWPSIWP